MALKFNPTAASTWTKSMIAYLSGDGGGDASGGGSVGGEAARLKEQMNNLLQPNVWTGAAAMKNFENFVETYNSMVRFVNQFGEAFKEAMKDVATKIGSLEAANLAESGDYVSAPFGDVTYENIANMDTTSIDTENVVYDYGIITGIGAIMNSIRVCLENHVNALKNLLEQIGSDSDTWGGTAAENTKSELLNIINSNMPAIYESLDLCINNIKTAAENAQNLDSSAA